MQEWCGQSCFQRKTLAAGRWGGGGGGGLQKAKSEIRETRQETIAGTQERWQWLEAEVLLKLGNWMNLGYSLEGKVRTDDGLDVEDVGKEETN